MLDAQRILATIQKAALLCRATPGRQGSIVRLLNAQDALVVGDLHGHLHNFKKALLAAALQTNPQRHLVLQELIHDPRCGEDSEADYSHRLVDLACALKCQYPDRVHILLGNHELSELTDRQITKNGVPLNTLFRRGILNSYADRAEEFRTAYKDFFRSLPLALRSQNRVLVCHTVPDGRDLDQLDLDLLRSGTWTEESMARGGTVYALTWGRDVDPATADRFAQIMDVDLFITGHHPCDDGFHAANHRHLILDATDPFPHACLFDAQEPATLEQLVEGVRLL